MQRRAQPAGQPVRVADEVRGLGSRPFRGHRPGDGCLARSSKRRRFLRWHQQQQRRPRRPSEAVGSGHPFAVLPHVDDQAVLRSRRRRDRDVKLYSPRCYLPNHRILN
uniref:Uncharacterized protein n=1 Tax=Zea mays TaxID=4577 RepID=C0PI13_MAIZE|nr:unknown [Zea mays]